MVVRPSKNSERSRSASIRGKVVPNTSRRGSLKIGGNHCQKVLTKSTMSTMNPKTSRIGKGMKPENTNHYELKSAANDQSNLNNSNDPNNPNNLNNLKPVPGLKEGPSSVMSDVYNLMTGEFVATYSLPPKEAVVAAWEQYNKNLNTWEYAKKMHEEAYPLRKGKFGWVAGGIFWSKEV